MGKNNNYSQQFDDAPAEAEEWQDTDDFEGNLEEESVQIAKEKQPNDKDKGQVRRNIEDIKEQQRLKALLGDDFYE